jgi:CubicO group peptidase (beta-lactamase class C family)
LVCQLSYIAFYGEEEDYMIAFDTQYLPEEVGYDKDRVETLSHLFEALIDQKKIISANYCLARDGKVFAYNAVGKLSYREEDERELKPDTIQPIASITKFVTSVAIWQLVVDGKLRVNQRVGEIIEEFDAQPFHDITIAHLLSHTSGMHPDGGCYDNKYFVSPWDFIQQDQGKNWIAAALRCGMHKKPGEEWAYCSFGFAVLGEVITRVSGVHAHDYITEHILKPCGMKDSTFTFSQEVYSRSNIPTKDREKEYNNFLKQTPEYVEEERFWSKIPGTGGALYSTAYDLCRFGIMLQQGGSIDGNRVIGRKAIEKMTRLYTGPEVKDYCWNAGGVSRAYGLGPDMRCNDASLYSPGTYFHEGAGGCCLIIDPTERMVAAWFIPFVEEKWCPEPLYNAAAVMWSGIK